MNRALQNGYRTGVRVRHLGVAILVCGAIFFVTNIYVLKSDSFADQMVSYTMAWLSLVLILVGDALNVRSLPNSDLAELLAQGPGNFGILDWDYQYAKFEFSRRQRR
ncbi:hypothetical protein [Labrys sp. 22185]|uniref:hypothetical protein n=1 Tax=Labrys sp. 22185 TaxID=3453888 RepID=UPI003F869A33